MSHPALAALEFHLITYKRTWRGSIFSFFVIPVLFLVGMGWSVGGYIDANAEGLSAFGGSYLAFLAPGLLVSTSFQVGIGEATHPVYGAFHWSRSYHMMRASPLTTTEILLGHLAYVAVRVAISATGFVLVMVLMGLVDSPRGALGPLVAILTGFSMTPLLFAFSAVLTDSALLEVAYRILVAPMMLFSGVFFPLSQMPLPAQAVASALPLWHGVELCRAAIAGNPTSWGVPAHLGYLSLWTVAGVLLARRVFSRQLAD